MEIKNDVMYFDDEDEFRAYSLLYPFDEPTVVYIKNVERIVGGSSIGAYGNGTVDSYRVFNRALTEKEIELIYNDLIA